MMKRPKYCVLQEVHSSTKRNQICARQIGSCSADTWMEAVWQGCFDGFICWIHDAQLVHKNVQNTALGKSPSGGCEGQPCKAVHIVISREVLFLGWARIGFIHFTRSWERPYPGQPAEPSKWSIPYHLTSLPSLIWAVTVIVWHSRFWHRWQASAALDEVSHFILLGLYLNSLLLLYISFLLLLSLLFILSLHFSIELFLSQPIRRGWVGSCVKGCVKLSCGWTWNHDNTACTGLPGSRRGVTRKRMSPKLHHKYHQIMPTS